MLKINIFILFVCAFMPFAASADLTASVDNKQIPYGETLEFRLSYEGADGNSVQPDFGVLQNEFKIYSQSSSVNSSFINGVSSQKREWVLTLFPKNEGKIVIPAIKAGKYSSQPLEIEVLSADKVVKKPTETPKNDDATVAKTATFSAELSVENENPYVEQGISAVLTIKDNRDLRLNEPDFENADNWIIKRLDKPQVITKNGENITTINYVMYPQKSGVLELPRAVIEGYYIAYESSPQNSFGSGLLQLLDMSSMFGVQKPVYFKSKTKTINVKPIPPEFKGKTWVPAEILVAAAGWLDKNPKFKVGETVAREITVSAYGVAEEQLPDIKFTNDTAWKQYPDKPQYASSVQGNKLISHEAVRVVYIPQKSGKLTLPKITIPWFNVKTQKTETAVIESEEIEVLPNEEYEAAITESPTSEIEKQFSKVQSPSEQRESEVTKRTEKRNDNGYMVLIAVLLAFLSGIIFSFLLFGRKNEKEQKITENDVFKLLKKNLEQKDYHGIRDSLVHWGEITFPDKRINNLNDLSEVMKDESFAAQCAIINAVLYGSTNDAVDGTIILNALKKTVKNKINKSEKPLPNLYK